VRSIIVVDQYASSTGSRWDRLLWLISTRLRPKASGVDYCGWSVRVFIRKQVGTIIVVDRYTSSSGSKWGRLLWLISTRLHPEGSGDDYCGWSVHVFIRKQVGTIIVVYQYACSSGSKWGRLLCLISTRLHPEASGDDYCGWSVRVFIRKQVGTIIVVDQYASSSGSKWGQSLCLISTLCLFLFVNFAVSSLPVLMTLHREDFMAHFPLQEDVCSSPLLRLNFITLRCVFPATRFFIIMLAWCSWGLCLQWYTWRLFKRLFKALGCACALICCFWDNLIKLSKYRFNL